MGTVIKNRGTSCVGVRKTGTTLIHVSTVMGTLYMDNIIMLGEHGITVETANDDMAGYYQKMEQAGQKEDNGIVSLADFMAVFFRRLRANR